MRRLDGYTTFGLIAYSLGFHLAVVMVATSLGHPTHARAAAPPPPSLELTEVELSSPAPAPAAPGAPGPVGAARSQPAASPAKAKTHDPPPSAPASPERDPSAVPVAATSAAPVASASSTELADAVRHAMLAPASSSSAAAGGGGGGGGAGLGSYKGMLAGWLQARVAGGGGAADEPHELLRVTARVSLSPERAITSYSIVTPSGHAAFDARIDARLRAIVSSGATLPPPPEGIETPPSLTVAFTCKPTERCA